MVVMLAECACAICSKFFSKWRFRLRECRLKSLAAVLNARKDWPAIAMNAKSRNPSAGLTVYDSCVALAVVVACVIVVTKIFRIDGQSEWKVSFALLGFALEGLSSSSHKDTDQNREKYGVNIESEFKAMEFCNGSYV